GLEYASVGEGLRMIADSPRNTFPDSPEGREEVLSTARRLIERVDALSSPHFGVRPSVGVEVERVPEFQEESSPFATYKPPAMDGSRPGLFVVNLRDVSKVSRGSLPTLVCHEAVPGHHFQLAIAQNLDGLPFFRKLVPFTAFTEGWALYAETLCDEMGFFDSPLARLGYLDAQMVRATRLIVDTGLHDREWTREQAITFMAEHTGLPLSDIEVEVNRYTMLPGQACGYMVGQQRILEIRGRAEDALGERFDAKAFHDRLLTFGSLPLDLLEREMDAWVDAEMRAQRP
ncbi:MAG: DUF885 domain-containing protein, partial [Proteobacteria bacterium]|nr:DUF885 domain-containing protein [Pseudomonadota bacterium]